MGEAAVYNAAASPRSELADVMFLYSPCARGYPSRSVPEFSEPGVMVRFPSALVRILW